MSKNIRKLTLKIFLNIILVISSLLFEAPLIIGKKDEEIALAEAIINDYSENSGERLAISEKNSLMSSVVNPNNPELKVTRRINVVITAYSSSTLETDDTPLITASGTKVKDGTVANNFLPFGTRIRIPEIYGDKIFVVEDRMNYKAENYHIDIWEDSRQHALTFGSKITYIEVLE